MDLFDSNWRDVWKGVETAESVGVVYTKPEIVALILDLAGYRCESALHAKRVLEPSCGDGAFLREIVSRLVESAARDNGSSWWQIGSLNRAVRAFDISETAIAEARAAMVSILAQNGCPHERANELANEWAVHGDFLLDDLESSFDFVVGNPPYVRLEDLPKRVLARYRSTYETLTDRADLYIAFIERSLQALASKGAMAFICANRFAKNQYGAALRRRLSNSYRVRYYLNLEHSQPFQSEVSAYPAIIVIDRLKGNPTRSATLAELSEETLGKVRADAAGHSSHLQILSEFADWYPNGEPWLTTNAQEFLFFEWLRENHPLLEDSAAGTAVGIGVATGADAVFVLDRRSESIESSRQLPLAMASDIGNDGIRWSGHFLINPFAEADDGSLVRLDQYPGLAEYFHSHQERLRNRHVARNREASWYRTIDRIWPGLVKRPKLLIPDIQSRPVIGLDEGAYYPHHNLYFVVSPSWDLRALKALLRSSFVYRQVKAYSVQMRGGALRYQAQTLRRVRIPALASLSAEVTQQLALYADCDDQSRLDTIASLAFRIPT